ncbi:MAG: transketolase C-terminal domain-containing protein [Desulforhopalus sp.]
MTRVFWDGNEAVARGALAAGCRFFSGYPITPATSIYHRMLQLLPPSGGVCMQGEDEISSIGMCLGAAMTGLRAMTATSGPGVSLFSEQLSFAIAGEIPLVIVDVQRLGPSTGSATRGADGDIQFLRWGNSGGLPVIVLAPVDVKDCFMLTMHAFDLAEKYRCPVFIASNKEVAMTSESFEPDSLALPEGRELDPFSLSPLDHSCDPLPVEFVPPLIPMGGEQLSRQTSSTHGREGYITTDPEVIAATIGRLKQKLAYGFEKVNFYESDCRDGDTHLLIVYGVTSRAARTALQELRNGGEKISLLVLKTLYPVPETLLQQAMRGKKKIVVVEMNSGQYVREIARLARDVPVGFHGKMNGELLSPEEIMDAVRS